MSEESEEFEITDKAVKRLMVIEDELDEIHKRTGRVEKRTERVSQLLEGLMTATHETSHQLDEILRALQHREVNGGLRRADET